MQKLTNRILNKNILYTVPPTDDLITAYDSIVPPCGIFNLLSVEDVMNLKELATSNYWSSRPDEKLRMIIDIMRNRGFKKLAGGTNRVVFKYMEDQTIAVKVAYDNVGMSDNHNEMCNQFILRPYCCKVFEVSPCGTVGLFERVYPISRKREFASVAGDIFDIICTHFVGKYVLADIGTKFFMNWGVRVGHTPVLLDFPYVYKLDGNKLYCNRPDPHSPVGYCGGEIDYDDAFNHLQCTKCGKLYLASDLKLSVEKKSNSIIIEEEDIQMRVQVIRDGKVIGGSDMAESKTYKKRKETRNQYKTRHSYDNMKVTFGKEPDEPQQPAAEEKPEEPKVEEKEPESIQSKGTALYNLLDTDNERKATPVINDTHTQDPIQVDDTEQISQNLAELVAQSINNNQNEALARPSDGATEDY